MAMPVFLKKHHFFLVLAVLVAGPLPLGHGQPQEGEPEATGENVQSGGANVADAPDAVNISPEKSEEELFDGAAALGTDDVDFDKDGGDDWY